MVRLPHPVLNNTQLDILCNIRYKGFNTVKLPIVFEVSKGKAGLQEALNDLCKKAEQSVTDGVNYIILSDRFVDDTHAAIRRYWQLALSIITSSPFRNACKPH